MRLRGLTAGGWASLAAVALVVAWAIPAQGGNWNQNAHYALVRALADGRPNIDRSLSETGDNTGDISFFHGHRYAAKGPGLAFWTLPAFMALKVVGDAKPSGDLFRILWFLGLWATVLPATILFLLVRKIADEIAPGFGTITAMTLGVATLLLPFTTMFFAHVLTAMLGFGAFALLWSERRRHARLRIVAAAGLLAGFAITVELPSAILVGGLACYLLTREPRVSRMLAYSGGVVLGVLPLCLFNQWAFGSITHLSYAGVAGGYWNRRGLYGVVAPSFHVATELLFSTRGLVRVTPVLALGAVGILLLHRRGRRAEAFLIAGLSLAYLLFNAGYDNPFGGDAPGPRYLIPIIPFLVLPLGLVYQRFPLMTIVLAAASAFQMIVITMTNPILAVFGDWFGRLWARKIVYTAFGFGPGSNHAMPLFALLLLLAAIFALLATPRPRLSRADLARAGLALLSWLLIAEAAPKLIRNGGGQLVLVYVAVAAATLIVTFLPRTLFRGTPPDESSDSLRPDRAARAGL